MLLTFVKKILALTFTRISELLASSVRGAGDAGSWGHEFESHAGCKDYVTVKSLKKKGRKEERKTESCW